MINQNVYIFDIDGTLTAPRQKIDRKFSNFFTSFCEKNTVFLATGSDYKKVIEQVTPNVMSAVEGTFTCMGNELWVAGEVVYAKTLKIPTEVITWLYQQLYESSYPEIKRGSSHFEYRTGMLNFSIVGRDIPKNAREEYTNWDKAKEERRRLAERFNKLFKHCNLEACIGGQISIDIQAVGSDKGQIFDYLNFYKTKVFFGDKCESGGNDFSLYSRCQFKFAVKNYIETMKILANIHNEIPNNQLEKRF